MFYIYEPLVGKVHAFLSFESLFCQVRGESIDSYPRFLPSFSKGYFLGTFISLG